MNTIYIETSSDLDSSLDLLWDASTYPKWVVFVKSLDENITKVKYYNSLTTITFKDEIAKTFFILKYS